MTSRHQKYLSKILFSEFVRAARDNNFYVQQSKEKEALENLPNPKIICYKLKM